MHQPFYDPTKTYDENYAQGPFGAFADGKVWQASRPAAFSFLGHPVDLPFGIPAGPLLNGAFVKAALEKGFPIVTYKTVRNQTYPCAQFPNVLAVKVPGILTLEKAQAGLVANQEYQEPLSITNSFGVPSKDPEIWQADLAAVVKAARPGQVVIGSFQGTTGKPSEAAFIEDCVETARKVQATGAPILEINLSCPNEGTSHLLCFDIERTTKIVKAIKATLPDTPLMIKIAYFADQTQLETLVSQVGGIVDGISAINTIPSKVVDENGAQALPGAGRAISGVCGTAIKPFGLEMVKRLAELRRTKKLSFTLIGVGGVMSFQDFFEYRQAGADVVMSATGAMWNPYLAQEIYSQIKESS